MENFFSGLVVEVLSPSTRAEDTLRKSGEYAEAGIGQYWIVDPAHQTLTVLANSGHGWDILAELGMDDGAAPHARIEVDGLGAVEVGLGELLDLS